MAYTPTVWKNGEFPPIDAEHLNKIEQGIANSAPGGFGLGELSGRTANSFSDITGYGFYRIPTESGFAPDTSTNWGGVYIGASLSYGTLLYARNSALMAVRAVSGGEVGPIEWINPPMELGTEYRTTERYLGKPVYCQLVNFGALPNATTKRFRHGISGIGAVIAVYGSAGDQVLSPGAFGGSLLTIAADNTEITIKTSGDISAYGAYVALKYTK